MRRGSVRLFREILQLFDHMDSMMDRHCLFGACSFVVHSCGPVAGLSEVHGGKHAPLSCIGFSGGVRKMKEIVPEFKSKQSKYEVLD